MGDSTPETSKNPGEANAVFSAFSRRLNHGGFSPDSCFLVGLSGGLDSTVMLHLLVQYCRRPQAQIRVAHVHHGLSPNAEDWSAFCREVCEAQGLSYVQFHVKLDSQTNLEASARQARYDALFQHLEPDEWLLVAHHRDDNVETLLLNLLRGAGPRGLAGIPGRSAHHRLFRPMMLFSRSELLIYARKQGLHWMEDESNLNSRFDRNYLRLQVLPLLRQRWPAADGTLNRAAENMQDASQLLDELAATDLTQVASHAQRPWSYHERALALSRFRQLNLQRQINLLHFIGRQLCIYAPSRADLIRLADNLNHMEKGEYNAGQVVARIYDGVAYLFTHGLEIPGLPIHWNPSINPEIEWGEFDILASREKDGGVHLSASDLEKLTVESPREGERIKQAGRDHHTSWKKLAQTIRIPTWERKIMPVIRVNGKSVFIPGVGPLEPLIAKTDQIGYVFNVKRKNTP